MSAVHASAVAAAPSPVRALLREEGEVWLFVLRTLLAFFLTGWIAMRLSLPQPSTAMLTAIIVANRQSGMVLAKSFYRALGTLAGALAAFAIVAAFPQQRELFLLALALWIGLCAGGATLYRNFTAYAFVLGGYTAAIIAIPVINDPPAVFDSATARISEVLLGLLVSGAVSDTVFPSRLRNVLRKTARGQFAHFLDFVQASTGGALPRAAMERAHLRFVRDAVALEDLRSSVVFEDAEARARSAHLRLFNQRFMAASTSFQSVHHLINRLMRAGHDRAAQILIDLYAPLAEALATPHEAGTPAAMLLPRLTQARAAMDRRAARCVDTLDDPQDRRDVATGVTLLERFADELHAYVSSAADLQAPRLGGGAPESVRFARSNDLAGAALATLRTTLVMLALGAFWIASAWPLGASAMLIATIFAGLFATMPDAGRATGVVMVGYAIGMAAAFACVFFVLTAMDGYVLMIAGIVPFLLPGLVLMAGGRYASYGLGYTMGFVYILAVRNPMAFDPVHFLNDAVAQLAGLSAAAIAFVFIPSTIGTGWLRRRQLARLRAQVALAAQAPLRGLRHRFESVNRDLFGQIVAQTEPGSDASRSLLAWALSVHETGRAMIELRRALDENAHAALRTGIDAALAALARFYQHPDADGYARVRAQFADVIGEAEAQPSACALLDHLYLIRLALLDRESALAPYMPPERAAPASAESPHAS